MKPSITYIDGTQQQQSGTQAHRVDGTKNEGHQKEQDAPRLG